jgi:LCP family protein required for cell wall assembly
MPENKGRKNRSAAGTAAIAAAIVLAAAAAAYGRVCMDLGKMNEGAAEIAKKPAVISVLAPMAELERIEGTPSDIDEDHFTEVFEPTQEPIYKQTPINERVINILLLGTDVRPSQSGNGRTDSIMLLSYNRDNKTAKLISIMRDIWVRIPERGWNRINAAFTFGNIGSTVNTINENFGLDIQNYMIIDFEGFKNIVDKLGGIEVVLDEKEIAYINKFGHTKLSKEKGLKLLNGEQMLLHCRNRKTGDGDFGRTRRQRDVMSAFFNKAKTIRDPVLLAGLIPFAMNHVQTNMTSDMIFTLGLEVMSSKGLTLDQGRIPFDDTWHYAKKDGMSVISADLKENTRLLHNYLYEEGTVFEIIIKFRD